MNAFFLCFLLVQDLLENINHNSENLEVIYLNCSVFYAIIYYQFKTSELKNVEKLVEKNSSSLEVLIIDWE